jgi:RNase H-like domain found in reverse transcriptase
MRRWAIFEKEAYAIVVSCERLDWLLQRPDGFSLFTDHNNLVYVFHPYGRNPSIAAAHTAAKLIRWALRLSTYRYTNEHVHGDDNVWTDMFTRWAAPRPQLRAKALIIAPLAPSLAADFEWPNAGEILLVQDSASPLPADSTEPRNPCPRLPLTACVGSLRVRYGFLPRPATCSYGSVSSRILDSVATVVSSLHPML